MNRMKIALAVIIGILIGIILHWGLSPTHEEHPAHDSGEQTAKAATIWTCAMHPEIRLPNPGLCPKCNMRLIPAQDQSSDDMSGVRVFSTSKYAKALMDIETTTVERKFVPAQIRMVGKVEYDETRVEYITSWVPGRLDRLYVDYTGVPVKKGEHMVYLYSPELLSAQEELIQAIVAVKNIKDSGSQVIRELTLGTLQAAKEKLRLWGLTDEQVSEIEKRGTASDHITIFSPASGIVVHKNAQEGMYVKTGTRIYTVVDLTHVWVKLDAYESDMMWLRYGQEVEFTAVSYPGEVFKGTISFIDPVLNSATRTIKIRVDVPNDDGKLKPGMFVKAMVKAKIATGGKVMDPKLAGKWICKMHPSVVKDEAGKCDICEMPLVQTETLGYVSADPDISEKPLVIPVTAALITGTRAVVYIELPDRDKPTYEGKEIILGPRAGNYYIVRSGLKEGDRVVTKGNFKIDSALQIQAKPSMMTPEGSTKGGQIDISAILRKQLNAVVAASQEVINAFDTDDIGNVHLAFGELEDALQAVDMTLLQGHSHMLWMESSMLLTNDAVEGKEVKTLQQAGQIIESLKTNIGSLRAKFGISSKPRPKTIKALNPEFRRQLDKVFKEYFAIQKALAEDKFEDGSAIASKIKEAIAGVNMKLLSDTEHHVWMKHSSALEKIISDVSNAGDIEELRFSFAMLSEQLLVVASRFGAPGKSAIYQLKCPMAFDGRGATWLQDDDDTLNPYFGSAMLKCGGVIEIIEPAGNKNIGDHQHD